MGRLCGPMGLIDLKELFDLAGLLWELALRGTSTQQHGVPCSRRCAWQRLCAQSRSYVCIYIYIYVYIYIYIYMAASHLLRCTPWSHKIRAHKFYNFGIFCVGVLISTLCAYTAMPSLVSSPYIFTFTNILNSELGRRNQAVPILAATGRNAHYINGERMMQIVGADTILGFASQQD